MNSSILLRVLSAACLASLGMVLGCSQSGTEAPAPGPAVVTVSRPVRRQVTDYARFTGRTAAVESVEVRARVSGYLTEVRYQPGQEVKAGEVLFKIDPVVYKAALDKAQADVTQYEAQFQELSEEFTRNRRLLSNSSISQEEFQKLASARDQARANIAGAKASVRTARQNLEWTDVTAPVAGKTGVNLLTKGNLVVADQTQLTTIVSQDPIYVYFDVDEATMLHVQSLIRQGKAKSYREAAYPVAVGLTSEQGYPHKGTIDYASNQVSPGTGTLNVRGVFSNKERVLTPGLFVRVRIPIGQPHSALLVTDRALGSDQGQSFVMAVDENNQVVRRNVEVGDVHGGGLREIRSGLEPSEWVIVDGLLRVRPGVAVEPRQRPMPESGAQPSAQRVPVGASAPGGGPGAGAGATTGTGKGAGKGGAAGATGGAGGAAPKGPANGSATQPKR